MRVFLKWKYFVLVAAMMVAAGMWFYKPKTVKASWNSIGGSDAEVIVQGGNGFGSTNTIVRRFSNVVVNIGSAITYADDLTYGASFLINTPGVYAITYTEQRTDNANSGYLYYIDIDSAPVQSTVTTIISGTTWSSVASCNPTNVGKNSITMILDAGDVVRPWWFGNSAGGTYNDGLAQFDIVKVR